MNIIRSPVSTISLVSVSSRVLDVAGGPDDQEGHVAVLLDLGALAALDRVLDRELVQLEDGGDVRRCRPRRARAGRARRRRRRARRAAAEGLGVVALARLALAVDVVAAVDDALPARDGVGERSAARRGAKMRVTARTGAVIARPMPPCAQPLCSVCRPCWRAPSSHGTRRCVPSGVAGLENRHRVSRPQRGVGVERPAHPVPVGAG